MAINLVTNFSRLVAERFTRGSVTEGFFNRAYDADFIGAKTVVVHSIGVAEMNDYNRTGTNRYGTPAELQDTKQELTITKDRSFSFTIDKGNNIQQNMIKDAGRALVRQIDEVVVPEIDTYRLGVIAGAVDDANKVEVTDEANYDGVLDAQEALDEANVPQLGRVLWANYEFVKNLKKDDGFILASDLGQAVKFNGQVGEVDGVPVIRVNSALMPDGIEAILAHPVALLSPMQLVEYDIHQNPPGISGHLVEGRLIYDAFVLDAKEKAIATLAKKA